MTEVLVSGRGLLESPRWHDGRLYVSDWSAGEVFTIDPLHVVARVDSFPLCFDWVGDDLVLVDGAHGRLLRRDLTTYATIGEGNWNDTAVRGNDIYVNQVSFEGPTGTVHLIRDGQVRRVAGDLAFPNGMAVLGTTLIVAESHAHRLTAFDIRPDGSLGDRRVWAEVDGSAPDGICVDGDAIWYADVPNKCCVKVAEGGELLDKVELDRGGFACALGDGTLYVTTAEWRGMREAEMVAPGSGQVVAVDVS